MAKTPEDYPTVQVNGGVDGGKCVKLETKDTGSFGSMVKMYIAAGNLFIGSFEVGQALSNAMKATHFGFPFFSYPLKLEGWYKYKAGANCSSKGEIIEGKKINVISTEYCMKQMIMYNFSVALLHSLHPIL